MANMSYCRFRNTLMDLRDCSDNFDESDISEEEEYAREELVEVCKEILEQAELLEECKETK